MDSYTFVNGILPPMENHGVGHIKLMKLMKEVLAPEDLAEIMACRMKGYAFRLMFYCNENGKRIDRGEPSQLLDEEHDKWKDISWAFTVFCSGCAMAHTFNFIASRNDLLDYSHMRRLTYG